MNVRWPLWIPAPRQDVFLFFVLAICTAYLLLGNFQNLPIIPALSKLPTNVGEVYFWLAAITIFNFSMVLKNSRNDYIFVRQQLLPCAVTTFVIVICLALIIGYRSGLSLDSPVLEIARYLLYSEIHAFVILNVSFLFKETSSPIREIASDVRCLDKISKTSRKIAEAGAAERKEQWNILLYAVQSLASTFAKHGATMRGSFIIGQTSYDLTAAAKAVSDQARALGSEVVFKRLSDSNSELAGLVRGIVKNATK
jgi:hypothetical protein